MSLRLVLALVMLALLGIVLAQNIEPVETRLLFGTVTMPRAVLILVSGVLGFVIGMLSTWLFRSRRRRAK